MPRGIFATALLALAGFLLLSSGVFAAEAYTSAYTKFDSDRCVHKAGSANEEDYGSWRCAGYRGTPVLLSAGDQRMFVTFGKSADDNLAESQTFPAFNDVYKGTVEWRLSAGDPKPFATILQWQVMTGVNDGQRPCAREGPCACRHAARGERYLPCRLCRRRRQCRQGQ